MLLHVGIYPIGDINDSLTDFNGSNYLSGLFYISNLITENRYHHGPCVTKITRYGKKADYALCFRCSSWPTEISDFSSRTKYFVWPPKHLVNRIIKKGCHVAAIGDKYSDMFALQWRISFAVAEQTLVASFSHVQLKKYALMKIFLKENMERYKLCLFVCLIY